MPKKILNENVFFRAVCSVCGDVIRISNEDRKSLHQSFGFYCSIDCLYEDIARPGRASLKHLQVCDPIIPKHDRKVFSQRFNIAFASQFEYHFANWLADKGEIFWYERVGIPIRESKTYTPDFLLPKRNLFIELKGLWLNGARDKLTWFRKEYPEVPLIVVPWSMHRLFYQRGVRSERN